MKFQSGNNGGIVRKKHLTAHYSIDNKQVTSKSVNGNGLPILWQHITT